MPINKITEEQFNVMQKYIDMYALPEYTRGDCMPIQKILEKVWNVKKKNLFALLGEELMISKQVSFIKSHDMMCDEINSKFFYSGETWEFINAFKDLTRRGGPLAYNYQVQGLTDAWWLAGGVYEDDEFSIPLPDGSNLRVQKGAKIMKILGKIAKAFELPGFEDFRIAHSQILNQKNLHGKLWLSIHPFDYMTMSHNNSGWNSCMDWTDDGSYRRGTVEMMNSDCVVVAYLEGSKEFQPLYNNDFVWNNKKWRQLFIVNEDLITGVKAYPYYNDSLEMEVLKWLKQLAAENMNWSYTNDVFKYDHDYKCMCPELDREISLRFWTNAMYNDFCSGHLAYLNKDIPSSYELSYSGPEQCMHCGSINVDFDGEMMLVCEECDRYTRCDNCGDRHDPEDMYELGNGAVVCGYCYDSYTEECSFDENHYLKGELTEVHLAMGEDKISRFARINFCDHCWYKFNNGEFDKYFKVKELHSTRVHGQYGYITYVNIDELTEEGVKLFDYENIIDAMIDFKEVMRDGEFYSPRESSYRQSLVFDEF